MTFTFLFFVFLFLLHTTIVSSSGLLFQSNGNAGLQSFDYRSENPSIRQGNEAYLQQEIDQLQRQINELKPEIHRQKEVEESAAAGEQYQQKYQFLLPQFTVQNPVRLIQDNSVLPQRNPVYEMADRTRDLTEDLYHQNQYVIKPQLNRAATTASNFASLPLIQLAKPVGLVRGGNEILLNLSSDLYDFAANSGRLNGHMVADALDKIGLYAGGVNQGLDQAAEVGTQTVNKGLYDSTQLGNRGLKDSKQFVEKGTWDGIQLVNQGLMAGNQYGNEALLTGNNYIKERLKLGNMIPEGVKTGVQNGVKDTFDGVNILWRGGEVNENLDQGNHQSNSEAGKVLSGNTGDKQLDQERASKAAREDEENLDHKRIPSKLEKEKQLGLGSGGKQLGHKMPPTDEEQGKQLGAETERRQLGNEKPPAKEEHDKQLKPGAESNKLGQEILSPKKEQGMQLGPEAGDKQSDQEMTPPKEEQGKQSGPEAGGKQSDQEMTPPKEEQGKQSGPEAGGNKLDQEVPPPKEEKGKQSGPEAGGNKLDQESPPPKEEQGKELGPKTGGEEDQEMPPTQREQGKQLGLGVRSNQLRPENLFTGEQVKTSEQGVVGKGEEEFKSNGEVKPKKRVLATIPDDSDE